MRPDRPRRALPRRTVLLGGISTTALALAGCGRVRLGVPATYTPPPAGIDDLYRTDLLALLDRGLAADVASADESAQLITGVRTAWTRQRAALLTGAEAEDDASAASDGATPDDPGAAAADDEPAPTDLQGLADLLVEIRDLTADAARQVSGSLARPMLAIGAFAAWAAQRLAHVGTTDVPPAPPTAEAIEPTREVPETDPPSIGAEVDYHSSLERAQEDEWFAGYMREVLAASAAGRARTALLEQSHDDRARAEELGGIAEEDGAQPVLRQAVYPIPGGSVTRELRRTEPVDLALTLLEDHVILTGAAPFERRPLAIAAALDQAVLLGSLRSSLSPLVTLVTLEAQKD